MHLQRSLPYLDKFLLGLILGKHSCVMALGLGRFLLNLPLQLKSVLLHDLQHSANLFLDILLKMHNSVASTHCWVETEAIQKLNQFIGIQISMVDPLIMCWA